MKDRLLSAARVLFDTSVAGRNVLVRPDDRFLVSYPKSGNTWLRFLIANLIFDNVGFNTIEDQIPDIYEQRNSRLRKIGSPRILKSHEYFDPRYGRVLYIVRDPRDVAISYFHHYQKFRNQSHGITLGAFIDKFLNGELGGYGDWAQNVGSWIGGNKEREGFLFVRYEDLRGDTPNTLRQIADHLDLSADRDRIQRSVENSDFRTMRALEEEQGSQWRPASRSRTDLPFVRSGKVGSWRESLGAHDRERIEQRFRYWMQELGYLE